MKKTKTKLTDDEARMILGLEQYGWGGVLASAAEGGLTGLGTGAVAGPWGMAAGAAVGTIAGLTKGLMKDSAETKQAAEQQRNAQIAINQRNFQIQDDGTGNWLPPQFAMGGQINEYSGQTHQGPSGGIPVDTQGRPSAVSGQNPVALTENGEVSFGGYIFSNKLKTDKKKTFADNAKKILNKYKNRLGDDFSGNDKLAKESMQKELGELKQKNEIERVKSIYSGGDLKKFWAGGPLGDRLPQTRQIESKLGYSGNNNYQTWGDKAFGYTGGHPTRPGWAGGEYSTVDQAVGLGALGFNSLAGGITNAILPLTGAGQNDWIHKNLGISRFPGTEGSSYIDNIWESLRGIIPGYNQDKINETLRNPDIQSGETALSLGTGEALGGIIGTISKKFPEIAGKLLRAGSKEDVAGILDAHPEVKSLVNGHGIPETTEVPRLGEGENTSVMAYPKDLTEAPPPVKYNPNERVAPGEQMLAYPKDAAWSPKPVKYTGAEASPYGYSWVNDTYPKWMHAVSESNPYFAFNGQATNMPGDGSTINSMPSKNIDATITQQPTTIKGGSSITEMQSKDINNVDLNTIGNNDLIDGTIQDNIDTSEADAMNPNKGIPGNYTSTPKFNYAGAAIAGAGALTNIARGIFEKPISHNPEDYMITSRYSPTYMRADEANTAAKNAYADRLRVAENMSPTQASRYQSISEAANQDGLSGIKERIFNINASLNNRAQQGNIGIEQQNANTRMRVDQMNDANQSAKENLISTGIGQLGNIAQGVMKDKVAFDSTNKFLDMMKASNAEKVAYMEQLIKAKDPQASATIQKTEPEIKTSDKINTEPETNPNVVIQKTDDGVSYVPFQKGKNAGDYNNPWGLGIPGKTGVWRSFGSLNEARVAVESDLQHKISNASKRGYKTASDIMAAWTGLDRNSKEFNGYIKAAEKGGVKPNTPVSKLTAQQLAKAILYGENPNYVPKVYGGKS